MTLVEAALAAFGHKPWTTQDLLREGDPSFHQTLPPTVQYALAHNRDGGVRALGRHLGSGVGPFQMGKDRQGRAIWQVRP